MSRFHPFALSVLIACLSACSSVDYDALENYYAHEPLTIVVVPMMNNTTDAEAAHLFQSTIVKPLVDRGYYVFPVELVAAILAQEGISDAGTAWSVPHARFARYFGADAILYLTLQSWDTTYAVLSSSVRVAIEYRLVHATTGEVLWQTRHAEARSSNLSGGLNPIGLIVSAVAAAVTAATTDYIPLAYEANVKALGSLPVGRYHESHAATIKEVDAWKAKKAARATKTTAKEAGK